MTDKTRYLTIWSLAVFTLLLAQVFLTLFLCGWKYFYSMEAAYIHLSVAENIAIGGYGINAGEFSSPSSSVLYPILLAACLEMGLGIWGPLIINIIANQVAVWWLLDFFYSEAVPTHPAPRSIFPQIMAGPMVLAINGLALPLTGMEHSLHVAVTVVGMVSLIDLARTGKPSYLLGASIIALPLIRFEGLSFSVAALAVLVATRNRWQALGIALLMLCGLIIFGTVMTQMGLPVLPTSILTQARIAAGAHSGSLRGVALELKNNLHDSLESRWGGLFLLAIGASISTLQDKFGQWRSWRHPDTLVVATMAFVLTAHFFFGKWNWWYRYEVYCVALVMVSFIYLFKEKLLDIQLNNRLAAQWAFALALAGLASENLIPATASALSSRTVYLQHYQVYRFATEYFPRSIAVGDFGVLSFRNGNYVLELIGLASEDVRTLRKTGQFNANNIEVLANRKGVKAAALEADKFLGDNVPSSWCRIAVLTTPHMRTGPNVTFFLVDRSAEIEMRQALARWAPTLPAPDTVQVFECKPMAER